MLWLLAEDRAYYGEIENLRKEFCLKSLYALPSLQDIKNTLQDNVGYIAPFQPPFLQTYKIL